VTKFREKEGGLKQEQKHFERRKNAGQEVHPGQNYCKKNNFRAFGRNQFGPGKNGRQKKGGKNMH